MSDWFQSTPVDSSHTHTGHVVIQREALDENTHEQVARAIVEIANLPLKLADLRAAQRRHVLGGGCWRSG